MSTQKRTAKTNLGAAHCHVCWNDRPLDEIRVLRCGHCFCVLCTAELKARNSPCPACRRRILPNDDGPLFITLVDTKNAKAKCVIDDLYKMDKNTEEEKVIKASERIQDVLEESAGGENEMLPLLWNAMEDFKTRIAAFYTTSKKQASKITALEKELSFARREHGELSQKLKQAKSLESEREKLLLRVREAERHAEAAVGLAERGTDDAVRLREEVVGLRAELEDERKGREAAEKENKQLKVWMDAHIRTKQVRDKKYRALQKQVELAKAAESRSTVDDSLVVLNDEELYESTLPLTSRSGRPPDNPTSSSNIYTSTNGLQASTPTSPSSAPRVITNIPNERYKDFECLPDPRRFQSSWPSVDHQAQKRKRVCTSTAIAVDQRGHVKGSVQLGPKRRVLARV